MLVTSVSASPRTGHQMNERDHPGSGSAGIGHLVARTATYGHQMAGSRRIAAPRVEFHHVVTSGVVTTGLVAVVAVPRSVVAPGLVSRGVTAGSEVPNGL